MTIDIGRIGIWTAALEAHPTPRARDAAQELEAMGYPVLWINEATGRDPFVLATMLLSATSTLKLATGIANVYARDALTMSASQKTLAPTHGDGERQGIAGVGVGHQMLFGVPVVEVADNRDDRSRRHCGKVEGDGRRSGLGGANDDHRVRKLCRHGARRVQPMAHRRSNRPPSTI